MSERLVRNVNNNLNDLAGLGICEASALRFTESRIAAFIQDQRSLRIERASSEYPIVKN